MNIVFPVAFLALLLPQIVFGCLAAPPRHVVVDSLAAFDQDHPMPPVVEVLEISRGKGPVRLENGNFQTMSTDDIGFIRLRISVAKANHLSGEDLGVRFKYVPDSGTNQVILFSGYDQKLGKEKASYNISIHWNDGATDEQEPLSGTLEVYLVDKAGNLSKDPGRARIHHAGK